MEILRGIDFHIRNSAVSLGKFDGIHKGHRLLLQEILQTESLVPTVFTFESGSKPGDGAVAYRSQIYDQREKDLILESLGMKREVLFPFHEGTRQMSPQDFIRQILCEAMDARLICVGEDFRFGKDRAGDVNMLKQFASVYGYQVKVIPKLQEAGDVISSTRIRNLLQKGELSCANRLLGEPFFFCGEVVHGNALGRTMQMPTANMIPGSEKVLPPTGVYATTVVVKGVEYKAVTNLGYKPTVGSAQVGVESCLLDFDQDIYGQQIQVRFHRFLRNEQKFADMEALHRQMEQDKRQAADALRDL
ncbi:MAG: bifunctional riboflavin kinase/FAD synthetase [Eubacteriales bacterium]|nr:bifunctional riboflavin kinase/FAD synthetase [Eubacteriales bacterium]